MPRHRGIEPYLTLTAWAVLPLLCSLALTSGHPGLAVCFGVRFQLALGCTLYGADGGSRTRTGSPPQDFKSCVSTSSTTSALKTWHLSAQRGDTRI